jgi:DNA repair ATPase RecN
MPEIAEAVTDAVERGTEGSLNSIVAVAVALAATFMALCNVKDGNIVQAMQQAQARAVDSWSYYQAKGTKQNLAEATLDQLAIQRELGGSTLSPHAAALLDRRIAEYTAAVKKYESQKAEILKEAEGYQHQYDALNVHDDQFDLSEAVLSVSIAILGITALTKKRWLLVVAAAFLFIGTLFGLAGLFGWSLHSDLMARLLG